MTLREQIAELRDKWQKNAEVSETVATRDCVDLSSRIELRLQAAVCRQHVSELDTLLASLDPRQDETGDTQPCENCDGVWDIAKMRLTADDVWLCARCMAELESEVRTKWRVPDESEWRSMDSAPKDDYILGYAANGMVDLFRWDDERHHLKPKPHWARKWMGRVGYDREFQPTHWMPLPAAPSLRQEPAE